MGYSKWSRLIKNQNISPPTPQKMVPKSVGGGGVEGSKLKSYWEMILSPKMMILHGVRHPISWIGICYAHGPQKVGVNGTRIVLDVATSLQGEFLSPTAHSFIFFIFQLGVEGSRVHTTSQNYAR